MTKTLDDLKKEGREEYCRSFLDEEGGISIAGKNGDVLMEVWLDTFAEKIWNTAIDTAIGNLPIERTGSHYKEATNNHGMISCDHWNRYREEALQTLLKMKA